jgi:hypothetical protein
MSGAVASASAEPATEPTDAGEQWLVPGLWPVSVRARLDHLIGQPMAPRKPQKPLDIGLGARAPPAKRDRSDEAARNPLNLF